jgi:uncharacterized membrane protein
MRSRAAIGQHPIHPALVAIPVGALAVAVIADLVGLARPDSGWGPTAANALLIGIVTALLAAVFGFVDWFAMPMSPAGKRLATIHMVCNLVAVALFALSWWLRHDTVDATPTSAVAANVVAFLILGVSGWIGGDMVYKHKLAVVENADPEATAIGQRERA